jgi:hypothetical protein
MWGRAPLSWGGFSSGLAIGTGPESGSFLVINNFTSRLKFKFFGKILSLKVKIYLSGMSVIQLQNKRYLSLSFYFNPESVNSRLRNFSFICNLFIKGISLPLDPQPDDLGMGLTASQRSGPQHIREIHIGGEPGLSAGFFAAHQSA